MPSLRFFLCALAATACSSPGPAPATSSGGQEPPETPPSVEAEVTEWSIGDQEDEGPHVFKTDRIHRIEVDLPAEAVNDLFLEPYELVVGSVTIDGAQLEEVGVRLRGKIGSFRTLDGKPKLKLDFNAFVDGRRFQGLEALSLNNSVVDCSYLKEAVSYRVFEELEVPASRYAYASVTINGLDYGLYGIVETQDDRYLNARWEQDDGNLYDGKYIWYGGHSYQLLDFGDGVDELYQLEEGDEVGHADIAAISTTLAEVWGQPDFYARMGELLDWEEIHREWAGEQWVGAERRLLHQQEQLPGLLRPRGRTGRADPLGPRLCPPSGLRVGPKLGLSGGQPRPGLLAGQPVCGRPAGSGGRRP